MKKILFFILVLFIALAPASFVLYLCKDYVKMKYFDIKEEEKIEQQQVVKQKKNVDIIATIGKDGWNNVPGFCANGANVFRINGSHIKSTDQLKKQIQEINNAILDQRCNGVRLMYDTQGPEIRTVIVEGKKEKEVAIVMNKSSKKKNKSVKVKNVKNVINIEKKDDIIGYNIRQNDILIVHTDLRDSEVVFSADPERNNNEAKVIHIGVNYNGFIQDVRMDMILTIENRLVYAKVYEIDLSKGIVKLIITDVNTQNGEYLLTDRRHINLIGEEVSLPTLTENDKEYIKIATLAGVKDYAISFVRDDKDIDDVKNLIANAFANTGLNNEDINARMKNIRIIAKIETKQGLDNIDMIMQKADGVMVARGDLASEIPMIAVPYAKAKIIETSNKYKKYSIMATDVLESITRQEIPSRNDLDVIATALQLDVDAIMLSNETAQGKKGEKAIKILKENIDFYRAL